MAPLIHYNIPRNNSNTSNYHDDIRAYIFDELVLVVSLVSSLLFNYMTKLVLFALPHFNPAQLILKGASRKKLGTGPRKSGEDTNPV